MEIPQKSTLKRRSFVKIALFLSALGALWPANALAEGHRDEDDRRNNGHGNSNRWWNFHPGPGFSFGNGGGGFPRAPFQSFRSGLALVPVSSVNGGSGGADFSASNPGGDGLGQGSSVFIEDNSNQRVFLTLRGAPGNTGFDILFERFNDHGREDLGGITTDANGNFEGTTPNNLGGNNRVGTIVIVQNGQDQYVSTVA